MMMHSTLSQRAANVIKSADSPTFIILMMPGALNLPTALVDLLGCEEEAAGMKCRHKLQCVRPACLLSLCPLSSPVIRTHRTRVIATFPPTPPSISSHVCQTVIFSSAEFFLLSSSVPLDMGHQKGQRRRTKKRRRSSQNVLVI